MLDVAADFEHRFDIRDRLSVSENATPVSTIAIKRAC